MMGRSPLAYNLTDELHPKVVEVAPEDLPEVMSSFW